MRIASTFSNRKTARIPVRPIGHSVSDWHSPASRAEDLDKPLPAPLSSIPR